MKDDPDQAVFQIDFSEKYTTQWQDEIQSAHGQKNQVVVFTTAFWKRTQCKSSLVMSKDLTHTKKSVITFLDRLLSTLYVGDAKHLGDGLLNQFKNKYIASCLPWLSQRHQIIIDWNYFATSHGKGCVHGIGGSIKRQVYDKVRQRRAIVNDAKSFFECANQLSTSISAYYIDADEITLVG